MAEGCQAKSVERGWVTMYSGARGFGWIAPESGGENIFFHVRNLASSKGFNETSIRPGEEVVFKRKESAKGIEANRVRFIRNTRVTNPDGRNELRGTG